MPYFQQGVLQYYMLQNSESKSLTRNVLTMANSMKTKMRETTEGKEIVAEPQPYFVQFFKLLTGHPEPSPCNPVLYNDKIFRHLLIGPAFTDSLAQLTLLIFDNLDRKISKRKGPKPEK